MAEIDKPEYLFGALEGARETMKYSGKLVFVPNDARISARMEVPGGSVWFLDDIDKLETFDSIKALQEAMEPETKDTDAGECE